MSKEAEYFRPISVLEKAIFERVSETSRESRNLNSVRIQENEHLSSREASMRFNVGPIDLSQAM